MFMYNNIYKYILYINMQHIQIYIITYKYIIIYVNIYYIYICKYIKRIPLFVNTLIIKLLVCLKLKC